MTKFRLKLGDCLEVMKSIPDNSFHAVVTDPPYGLFFMNRQWDHGVPGQPYWEEVLRVSKPGAHLLAFGGTRTHHRLMVAIEDAGWEIRDCLMWLYGSGMPKGQDISKAIDKMAGAEREVVGEVRRWGANASGGRGNQYANEYQPSVIGAEQFDSITVPATDEAKQWDGWGTGLKPAWEPVILARKPISEKTIAANVLKWGTGAIDVDACRIETTGADKEKHLAEWDRMQSKSAEIGVTNSMSGGLMAIDLSSYAKEGRWPANLILDEEAGAMLPDSKGQQGDLVGHNKKRKSPNGVFGEMAPATDHLKREDSGSAARFFYCAKASKRDRGEGNDHPTVKPTSLMMYLCKLITPPNGIVFDPFMGSGSTGKAALLEAFRFYGIELDQHSFEIAEKRVENAASNS